MERKGSRKDLYSNTPPVIFVLSLNTAYNRTDNFKTILMSWYKWASLRPVQRKTHGLMSMSREDS